jgi:Coenzyme PQQ synthesis protein D (PqqD)
MSHVRPGVVGRRLEDRFVLVNLRSNRIYELNPTATALWELLEAGTEVSELEPAMADRFDVEPDELRREIDATLRTLADAGLVNGA